MTMPLLDIRNLQLEFGTGRDALRAVDGVSFTIAEGETLCLVGESGCGKSVSALSIARLVPTPPARYVGGEILLNGHDVLKMEQRELRSIRGGVVSYVFQEPSASLNPVFRVGNQIKESLKLHRPQFATDDEVIRLLKLVGIPAPESRIRDYPHQMSGGMQQRIMIAMALASEPKLLVADEPTTALDVTIQDQILKLLLRLVDDLGMGMVLVTHDLGVVAETCDRVAVMYAGRLCEAGRTADVFAAPRHAYTHALLGSMPGTGAARAMLTPIPGQPPKIDKPLPGCAFAPRCAHAEARCVVERPAMERGSACFAADRLPVLVHG